MTRLGIVWRGLGLAGAWLRERCGCNIYGWQDGIRRNKCMRTRISTDAPNACAATAMLRMCALSPPGCPRSHYGLTAASTEGEAVGRRHSVCRRLRFQVAVFLSHTQHAPTTPVTSPVASRNAGYLLRSTPSVLSSYGPFERPGSDTTTDYTAVQL
jgi:hypothetical protein